MANEALMAATLERYVDRQACHRRDLAKIEESLDNFVRFGCSTAEVRGLLDDVRQMQRELEQEAAKAA